MDLPVDVKTSIEQLSSCYSVVDLKKSASLLTEKYLANQTGEEHIVSSKISALTYAICRMPATYSAIYNALKYSFLHFNEEISSILDVGAGVGTASIACSSFLGEGAKIIAIEREDNMISLGKELTSNIPIEWKECDYRNLSEFPSSDLIIASYTLNEIDKGSRENVFKKLFSSAKKLLIIVEPGTPLGFSQIKSYRDLAISLGGFIVAPCPNCDKCKIEENDWCHFLTRVSRTKLHKLLKDGDAPFEDEKFSYVAISKTPILKKNFIRVIRHPIVKGNSVNITGCCSGSIKSLEITKKDKNAFKTAKKCSSGDELEV